MPIDISSIPHECIQCDAEDCTKTNPRMSCSRCKTVYYCDRECQKRHWKEHKPYCFSVEEMRGKLLGMEQATRANSNNQASGLNDPCPICFVEPMENPMVIPSCQHAFCFGCLREYQEAQRHAQLQPRLTVACPLCRSNVPDVQETALDRATALMAKSNLSKTDPETKKSSLESAMQELDNVLGGKQKDLRALLAKAEVLADLDRHAEARETLRVFRQTWAQGSANQEKLQEYLRRAEAAGARYDDEEESRLLEEAEELLRSEPTQTFAGNDQLVVFQSIAEIQQQMGDWNDAKESYKEMVGHPAIENIPTRQRAAFHGLCRCMYELGDYKKAIYAGDLALKMNRHYPGAHKYVALAHKKSGSLEKAQCIMNQAVLYETPWDDSNRAKVSELYMELMNESAVSTESMGAHRRLMFLWVGFILILVGVLYQTSFRLFFGSGSQEDSKQAYFKNGYEHGNGDAEAECGITIEGN